MRTAKNRLLSVFARLALILLIQCPLPVLHAHGATAAELSNIPSLPEHVRRFHDSRVRVAHPDETFGWHVHVLPPLGMPGHQRGDEGQSPDVDLPWRCDSDSDSTGIQLVQPAVEPGSELAPHLPPRADLAGAALWHCDTIGEISRRQRQAILRA